MTRAVLAFLLLVGASPVIAQGALTVTSVSPSDGAVGIPLAQIIRISFSDELDLTTVTSDTVFLTDSLGNVVQSQFSFSTTQVDLRRLSSTDLLLPDETYTVHVTTGVTDVLGNTLKSEFTSTFTTR